MENQQLLDYVKQQLQQGADRETIKTFLTAQGEQEQAINEAFQAATPVFVAFLKKKKWKKIVLIIAGVIILLVTTVIFLPGVLGLFAKDVPPINDSDILLKKISVPNSENAYFDLTKLNNNLYEPEGKSELVVNMAAGKSWDEAVAEEIVTRNSEFFEYFAEAARKSKFQDPVSADPAKMTPNAVLPSLNSWRRMARLSAIRAMFLAKQGKDKEAIEEALNSVKIGQKIQESQVLLIEYVVAILMKGTGLEAIQRIVTSSKLNGSKLASYAQELNAFYKNEDGLINSFKAEYLFQSWAVDFLASGNKEALQEIVGEKESENPEIAGKVKNSYYFQPNKTKLTFAEYARQNIKIANQPCGEIKVAEVPRLAPTSPAKLYAEENAIGKVLHDVIAASPATISTKKCEEDLLVAATQAIVAIKAYKNDNGNYPTSLNDLVPRYLSSVPTDFFDGRPLKYSSVKKIVYSVGQGLQDLGGSTGSDWHKMPNPTFKIDF
ncbi:MAG: hypothetical protein A3H69_06065 [Candidatus Sungbacteria bacterium RIFCSPLOWO2_02_FULL_47_9]|uniref:Uncharacterized protein n=1 Tax=Candidatus Sungbacteria bacterium RIFCSPHIGHO2_01_FULL_47_32 TaxID=1802264 RepID=A0A1G2K897_9BACT|nr:MAG: hypothetical protein UX72_C0012G0036 [Parcubacteria group bacterium GW2011_GWA2_47_10]OGZ95433.1 MAG: hypothetical protein A2633_05925 [Candidatus Sungbacteria bacterium RIFCSPHIGHO2_01_FULL_47_32]OGZ99590.1 MAG: hypothetical protein A3D57_01395 [Candidatus Sungbacteria bacterium RIFCSPHIGHO2_02_FULL_46_12]OHA06289.1 MAG: hypothetical protein A3A28_02245 [Candidatus Sungbacteria bacterium RIFCSPLOWO2_01_FULL_47_32]OHA09566.1 MAG: hypothetical protein A3H69_06065 [Candidatus Sungbacteria